MIVQITVVTPRLKELPARDAVPVISLTTDATEQLSAVAVGSNSLATVVYIQVPASVFLFWLATQLIVGGMLSITVTVNPQVVVLPEPSVIVHTTEVDTQREYITC